MNLLHKTSADTPPPGTPQPDRGASRPAGQRPPLRFRPSAALGWAFVVLVLVTGPLEFAVPDQSGSAYFSAAGLGALAVLGTIVLTELRRARAMSRSGMAVERIEIGFLRGRPVTTDEPSTPRDLRRISWAGPLTLGACAILLAAVGGALQLGSSTALDLLAYAALFTAMGLGALALTELLPAPGSPGSQLIFARAWKRTGERGTAVLPTAKAGLISGWALLIAGAAVVLLVSFAGLWLMFIGGMVIAGSKLTLAGARTRQQLAGVRARDVMSPAPPEVSAFATAEVAFADVALPSRASVLVVRETDGTFGGIVPVPALAAVPGDDRAEVRVRRLALGPQQVAVVDADQPMEQVLDALARHPLGGVALVRAASPDAGGGAGGEVIDAVTLEKVAAPGTTPAGSLFVGLIAPADVARTVELAQAGRPGRNGRGGRTANPWIR